MMALPQASRLLLPQRKTILPMMRQPVLVASILAVSAVVFVALRANSLSSASPSTLLLHAVQSREDRGAALGYVTDREANKDMVGFFDRMNHEEQSLKAEVKQMLVARHTSPVRKREAEEAAVDRQLQQAESQVATLKKQKLRLEQKDRARKVKAQSLKIRELPKNEGAYPYGKLLPTERNVATTECIPPKVMLNGECKNYLKMDAEEMKAARDQLRKEGYYRYKWAFAPRGRGQGHRFKVVPKRFPHADGADLGDNYLGLDCGTPDCRASGLDDKYTQQTGEYPKARIPKLFRPFTSESFDLRKRQRPQQLPAGIEEADKGTIDSAWGDFFSSHNVGYQHYMEQFQPWDHIVRKPQRVDRFRPLADKAANHAEGTHGAKMTKTLSGALGGGQAPGLVPKAPFAHEVRVVQGARTDAEKALLDGAGSDMFEDDELPAEDVQKAKANDSYLRAGEGEPLTDAAHNNWDGFNAVPDRGRIGTR